MMCFLNKYNDLKKNKLKKEQNHDDIILSKICLIVKITYVNHDGMVFI